ncbi:MAG: pseudouridine synthase [Gammaproteobacteria bacterium]|nr:pseudouridine synthase [Gammaproteobacteria bacterium]
MAKIIVFNKPFGVLSQFTAESGHGTLADYIDLPGFYPAGRLDKDSEGLLLLTNDGQLQQAISNPRYNKKKHYLVQVEGVISEEATKQLTRGVTLRDGQTRPATATVIAEPALWSRNPPVRFRQHIPTSWLRLQISEGRNRQVRRMTAAVGFPTLRLVRVQIDLWDLQSLQPGQWRLESA